MKPLSFTLGFSIKATIGQPAASTETSEKKHVAKKTPKTGHLWNIMFPWLKWTSAPRRFLQNLPKGSFWPPFWAGLHFRPQNGHFGNLRGILFVFFSPIFVDTSSNIFDYFCDATRHNWQDNRQDNWQASGQDSRQDNRESFVELFRSKTAHSELE